MQKFPNFYKERVSLNVLANSIENAKECFDAADGHMLVGILSKDYETVGQASTAMENYQKTLGNAISIGLGVGDPNQSQMVTELAGILQPQHVNQVFTGVGASRQAVKQEDTFINGLVSPTGKVGYVNIATGPLSSEAEATEVPIETAIALLKDMGASSLKYFPMKGLAYQEEYQAVAEACATHNFALEPTGGIDLENFEEILQIAVDAGVEKIIPHVYSSIIDSETGATKPEDVAVLFEITKKVLAKD